MKHRLENLWLHIINSKLFQFITLVNLALLSVQFIIKKLRSEYRRSCSQYQLMGMKPLSCHIKNNINTLLIVQQRTKMVANV
uniref:Uncharacterized protein n=1 Tax=Arundo donax TaxID=35708 RepID=A0A0A9E466_ARUDO